MATAQWNHGITDTQSPYAELDTHIQSVNASLSPFKTITPSSTGSVSLNDHLFQQDPSLASKLNQALIQQTLPLNKDETNTVLNCLTNPNYELKDHQFAHLARFSATLTPPFSSQEAQRIQDQINTFVTKQNPTKTFSDTLKTQLESYASLSIPELSFRRRAYLVNPDHVQIQAILNDQILPNITLSSPEAIAQQILDYVNQILGTTSPPR